MRIVPNAEARKMRTMHCVQFVVDVTILQRCLLFKLLITLQAGYFEKHVISDDTK